MIILGIETSCDETAAAVVENGIKIISNAVASSVELHQKTGGIIPEVAAREQSRCIIPVIEESINGSRCQASGVKKIDAIAVTIGPGLIGSLLVGIETAKTLAYVWQKPIVPVNHLQAHLYANWLEGKNPQLPALGLVVSGGHTDLVLMKGHACPPKSKGRRRGKLKWLGGTRDDAAGECFDKTARVLGLPYPGGPEISRLAEKGNPKTYNLPRPMLKQENFDFSFSGLKTAVINKIKEQESKRVKIKPADMAAGIQQAIADILVEKTIRAAKKFKAKSVLLAGGVAANKLLREKLGNRCQVLGVRYFIPSPKLCTDNATYIASCAYFNYKPRLACPPLAEQKIQANPSLRIEEMIE